ncbi:MAG: PHP domain-containing protein [Firmicutes bacterium]|nr:PHP domain-containing protein [Bacillota bacterium]
MRVDLHVHTSKYSDCGKATPEAMVESAIDAGLDAIVLAEHNYLWSREELAELQRCYPTIRIFGGIEVSISWEEHIVVLGVPDASLFYPLMPPAELIKAVLEHQGAAILAHPFRWSTEVRPDILAAGFDAIEVYSTSIREYMQQPIAELQRRCNLPLVATSDGHHTGALGLYAIELERAAKDERDLAALVREGKFRLWTNPEAIAELNADIDARLLRLAQYRDWQVPAALKQVGLSRNLTYAVEQDMSIRFPEGRGLSESNGCL